MKVLVLGAGVIGTTSAYFLAKQGHDVTVIDRQDSVAMETSHANAGCLSYGFTSPLASPGLPFNILKWALSGRSPLVVNPNMSIETIKFMYRLYKNCNSKSYEVNKSRMLRIANYSQKALLEIEADFDINYVQRKQGSLQLFWDSKEIDKAKKDISILEKFNIKIDKGHIITNEWLETDEKGIFAIGDVTEGPWLAHKASHEGVLCVEKIAGHKNLNPIDKSSIPGCTYCRPQVASIGLTEKKANLQKLNIKVGKFPFVGNGKAIALGDSEGLIKTIFNDDNGELIGAHMVGPEVTELIQGFSIAKKLETTEYELMHTIFPHPTLSEAMHESVLDAYDQAIHY